MDLSSPRAWVATAFAVAALLLGGPVNAAPDAFDQTIRAELEREAPAAVASWDAANAARDANRPPEAEAAYREVISRAPDFYHAHRRLCGVLDVEGRNDDALVECRKAYTMNPDSAENEAALAASLVVRDGDPNADRFREAYQLIINAQNAKPDDEFVVATAAQIALRRGDAEEFRRRVGDLQRIAPNGRPALLFGIMLDLGNENPTAARAKLEQAKRTGVFDPEEQRNLGLAIDAAQSKPSSFGHLALGVAKVVGWWAGGLVVLLLLGALLSHATLRATQAAGPGTTGAALGGTAWIRRLYAALIAVTSIYFYVSLPLVALLVLGAGAGVVYCVLATGFIAPKLFIIVILVVGGSLLAIVRSVFAVFRRPRDQEPGIPLERGDHPRLDAILDEVSKKVGTRGVDRVFLGPGTNMSVFERGSMLETLRGRGERCLVVGGALLPGFRVRPFKAVLAHEFGHFKNEDTAGGVLSLAVRRSLGEMVLSLARGRAASRINPAWLFVEGFHKVFVRITHGASRLQEILADRWAVSAYGSKAFTKGLRHVIESSARFDVELDHAVRSAASEERPLANLYRGADLGVDRYKIDDAAREALERDSGSYDSHPSPQARFDAARAMAVAALDEPGDKDKVWSLFENRAALEHALLVRVSGLLAASTGIVLKRQPEPAG